MDPLEKFDIASFGFAAQHGTVAEVEEHLKKDGIHVNIRGETGDTALHSAALGNIEVVKFLLSHGADVNVHNYDYGSTPLHLAAGEGKGGVEVLKLLISAGANINAKDNDGETPLDMADLLRNYETAQYLKSVGGRRKVRVSHIGRIVAICFLVITVIFLFTAGNSSNGYGYLSIPFIGFFCWILFRKSFIGSILMVIMSLASFANGLVIVGVCSLLAGIAAYIFSLGES